MPNGAIAPTATAGGLGSAFQQALPYGIAGGFLGGGLTSLFGGGVDYEAGIDRSMQQYRQYMQQAQQALEERERYGREAITGGVERAQVYGEPYRAAGAGALGTYMGGLGLGGSPAQQAAQQAFQTSPGYQFAMQEGLRGIQRGMAPTGLRGSGAEQRALMRYGTGLAGQEYGRWQEQLAGLAGLGAGAAEQAAGREYGAGGQLAGLGLGYGGQLAGLYGQMGQAQAESELAKLQMAQQAAQQRSQAGGTLGAGLGMAMKLAPLLL